MKEKFINEMLNSKEWLLFEYGKDFQNLKVAEIMAKDFLADNKKLWIDDVENMNILIDVFMTIDF